MIKSSRTSTKFANKCKQSDLKTFLKEYKRVSKLFVDILWDMDDIPKFLPKEITNSVDTWLSARMLQCIGKQMVGVVKGTQKKQKQRLYIIEKLKSEKQLKKSRKLQRIYDSVKCSKPNLDNVCPELDSRFIKIDMKNNTSFDGWVVIGSIGNKMKIKIPFKKNKHLNQMLINGKLKSGIRLTPKSFTFMFDIQDVTEKSNGDILGIDIGQVDVLSCSNGYQSKKCNHGHNLSSIQDKLSRKQKGSKSFKRAQEHRKNYINWTVNQLNLDGVKQLNLENIKNLRCGRKSSRKLSHWKYTTIKDKLESKCKEQGVLVNYVSPTYTSQRCSCCGWTRKSNRRGKLFRCEKCSHEQDSDLNASKNIALNLNPIGKQERLKQKNRTGFYWNVLSQKPIVSDVKKT